MKKRGLSVVIFVASLLLAVTLLDTWILYTQTHHQTRQAGAYQLESVSRKLESSIGSAENLTMEEAIKAREYLKDKKALKKFIYSEKAKITAEKSGAFNVYIAGSDLCIIPDFDIPDDYVATERVWYKGALQQQGKPYVSSPYQDAMTKEICYTVSVMLGDGDTVVAVDYTMESIRGYIGQMANNAVSAVIVTNEGIIAGCSDESKVGKKLVKAMPDHAGIYASAKNKDGVVTGRVKDGLLYENLFAARSGNGWYLIVGISDWELYKNAYIQLFVTVLLSLALFSVIIMLYISALKSREKTEKALASREEFLSGITSELAEPLHRILERSSRENVKRMEDYEAEMAAIHTSGEQLSEMMNQIISYKSIVASAVEKQKGGDNEIKGMDKRFRFFIITVLTIVMCLSLYTNITSVFHWGNARMEKQAADYEYRLSEWINTQKSILDMFVSTISTHPEMLDDYEGTVKYLKEITEQYPEISVTYMTNPELKHTVYMSNGWEPDANWKVEERQWYIDTLASEKGWSISAPYFDDQTGGYCLTISKMVYDARTGEFLGVFGIDFFMDKLVDILGDSYSQDGYAFLVDPNGVIINHPYGKYQMTQERSTNVQSLAYGEIQSDGKTVNVFRDYDGALKILVAVRNRDSNFTVYVVSNIWKIYGNAIVYGLICLMAFLFCIILIYRLLSYLIRWQEKTNRELTAAADAAISAGKAKSSFLAQMSHEIRTPINVVLGMNEMILRESEDHDILDYADNIRSAGRTLLSLINSILDFSKIEDGKMELVPVKYDVSSLIGDLVVSISERAKAKNLKFDLNVDNSIPSKLFGDDVRIRQVIMNLLTNAVKYTEKGRVVLTISNRGRQNNQVMLFVSVKDTGIGIRDEDRQKLFESFERLDVTRNRNIEGTGLGMSIVTKLLDMMGSSLSVDSVYGEGSEFSFVLAQEIIEEEPIGDFNLRLKNKADEDREKRYLVVTGASVLVVDDNEMNRKVAKSLMKRNGIVPDLAVSGEETIRMMREKRYDLVFLDHMMPKMDGIETLAKLREENLIPEGCVMVALTANAVSGAKDRYLEAGFDDYLSKPINVVHLEKIFAKLLPDEMLEWRETDEKKKKQSAGKPAAAASGSTAGTTGKGETADGMFEFAAEESASGSTAGTAGKEEPMDGMFEFAAEESASGSTAGTAGKDETTDGMLEFAVEDTDDGGYESASDEEFGQTALGTASVESLIDKLAGIGVDTESALVFCGGEEEFYAELLADYVNAFPDKKEELDELFAAEDWHEFEVKIHAVKSTSKTVGVMGVSDQAFTLEKAASEENISLIREMYPGFAEESQKMIEEIKHCMNEA